MVWVFLEFLQVSEMRSTKQSYLYRIKKIRLYLYEDDFKLCGAVQMMLVGRNKRLLCDLWEVSIPSKGSLVEL